MPILVGEANHLVLDRRTVTRPPALDLARIHRGPVEVGPDDVVHRLVRVGDVAIEKRLRDPLRGEAEWPWIRVAELFLALREVDGSAIEATGRPSLETSQLKAERRQAVAERLGRLIAGPAAAGLRLAGVHDRLEERAGRQNHRRCAIERVAAGPDADDPARFVLEDDRLDGFLSQREVIGLFDPVLERELVQLLVRLGSRRMHRGALRLIQHAELETGDVGDPAHLAAERVDLADDLPLGDAADRGIAAHRADGVGAHREEGGAQAHPRGCQGRFGAGVAGADDDHVVVVGQCRHRCILRCYAACDLFGFNS